VHRNIDALVSAAYVDGFDSSAQSRAAAASIGNIVVVTDDVMLA
jgi:hypothetical protein